MPTLADLDTAMLRPGRSVPAVSRLGGGAVVMGGPARPRRVVGAANVVYQLRQGSGRVVALRCPLADPASLDPAMGERYHALAVDPALARLRGPDGPLVANLAFVPDGIAFTAAEFRTAMHPLVAMDWITGPTLTEAVDRACRDDDRPYLAALADAWVGLLAELADAGFDHGDLVPDNVLIGEGGGLTLIDYDGSAWPGAPRPPTGVAPGPAYAHPAGGSAPVGRRDRFPSLVVYASLRVLAAWPGLRAVHGDPPGAGGAALLFAPRDLRDSDASPLFRELRGLDDPAVPGIVGALRAACRGPAAAVPALGEVAGEWPLRAPTGGRSAGAGPGDVGWQGQGRRRGDGAGGRENRSEVDAARAAPGWAGELAPSAAEPDRGRAATDRGRGSEAMPPGPPGAGAEARERQRRLTHLNGLLVAGDEEGARRYWGESGLATDPEAVRELGPRMADLERRRLLRRAQEAAEAGDAGTLLRLWRDGRFEEYRPAAPLRPAMEAARRRLAATERLRTAIEAGDRESVARLWPEAGGGALPAALTLRARALLGERLARAAAEARRRGDDESVVALVEEARGSGVPIDAPTRRAARLASERVGTRRALRAAETADDREELAALALSGRLEELGPLPPTTLRAARRALAWPTLERALDEGDDAAILAAYDEALFGDDPALSAPQRSRIELARRRTAWLEGVRGALRARDGEALRRALAATPPGAERRLTDVERRRVERLATRGDAAERLATALREGPDAAIVEALNRIEAAGAPLPEALDWAAVRGVADRLSLARAIREAAAADPPDYARLARLLPTARAAMAGAGVGLGADIDFAALEADVLRSAHLARLRDALARGDDAAIAAAARPDPFGALERLSEGQRARVERALASRAG